MSVNHSPSHNPENVQEPDRVNASEEEFIQREIAQLRREYMRDYEVDHWNSDSGEFGAGAEEEAVAAGAGGQGGWVEEAEEEKEMEEEEEEEEEESLFRG